MATRELSEVGLDLLLDDVLHWPFPLTRGGPANGDDADHEYDSARPYPAA